MSKNRALKVALGLALCSAAACADPGVTHVAPIMGSPGQSPHTPTPPAAGTPPAQAPAGQPVAGPTTPSAPPAGPMTPPPAAAGAPGAAGSAAAPAGAAGASAVAGSPGGAMTGTMAGGAAGAAPSAAGAEAPAPAPKCPAGWNCMDVGAAGFIAKDGAGNDISFSCSNGELVECDDANPAASCPALSNPFCAHVDVAGSEIITCGQTCTP